MEFNTRGFPDAEYFPAIATATPPSCLKKVYPGLEIKLEKSAFNKGSRGYSETSFPSLNVRRRLTVF